jgi:hypothetical protein
MAKAEISWNGRAEDGEPRLVYAQHVGNRWLFYARARRYDRWQPVVEPPLEDWLALLDAVERRVNRRRLRPEEPERIRRAIRERFPDACLESTES